MKYGNNELVRADDVIDIVLVAKLNGWSLNECHKSLCNLQPVKPSLDKKNNIDKILLKIMENRLSLKPVCQMVFLIKWLYKEIYGENEEPSWMQDMKSKHIRTENSMLDFIKHKNNQEV